MSDDKCIFCSKENSIIESEGYKTCKICGLVNKIRVSDMIEWGIYIDSNSGFESGTSSRCGNIIDSTEINPFNKYNSFIPKTMKKIVIDGKIINYDISKVHIKNNFNYQQKTFNQIESMIDNKISEKYANNIVNTTKILWGEIMKTKKVLRAGVRKGIIACCLYYSCVYYGSSRTPNDICKDFGMNDTKNFNKGDKEFIEIFRNDPKWGNIITKSAESTEYFSRFCSILEHNNVIKKGKSFQIAKNCKELYEEIKSEVASLFPKGIACAIIIHCIKQSGEKITKNNISKNLDICNPSLSKCCKILDEIISSKNQLRIA